MPPASELAAAQECSKHKTDFVFRMFWSLDSKGRIKAFLWGWLSAGESRAGAQASSSQGIRLRNAMCCHQGGWGWPGLCPC